LLPTLPAAPALVRSAGGHFMDKPDKVISLINLATVRTLEQRWGVEIDPLRFRANVYIDGAKPWEEFDWIGSEIGIGGAVFAVDRKNGRCGATNVNPATGRRDLDIPSSLRAAFGHKNFDVYLIVRDGGQIAVGDSVFAPRSRGAAPGRSLADAADEWRRAPLHLPGLLLRLRGSERSAAAVDQAGNDLRRHPGELAVPGLRHRKDHVPALRRKGGGELERLFLPRGAKRSGRGRSNFSAAAARSGSTCPSGVRPLSALGRRTGRPKR
jgi:MOSC domain